MGLRWSLNRYNGRRRQEMLNRRRDSWIKGQQRWNLGTKTGRSKSSKKCCEFDRQYMRLIWLMMQKVTKWIANPEILLRLIIVRNRLIHGASKLKQKKKKSKPKWRTRMKRTKLNLKSRTIRRTKVMWKNKTKRQQKSQSLSCRSLGGYAPGGWSWCYG